MLGTMSDTVSAQFHLDKITIKFSRDSENSYQNRRLDMYHHILAEEAGGFLQERNCYNKNFYNFRPIIGSADTIIFYGDASNCTQEDLDAVKDSLNEMNLKDEAKRYGPIPFWNKHEIDISVRNITKEVHAEDYPASCVDAAELGDSYIVYRYYCFSSSKPECTILCEPNTKCDPDYADEMCGYQRCIETEEENVFPDTHIIQQAPGKAFGCGDLVDMEESSMEESSAFIGGIHTSLYVLMLGMGLILSFTLV